MSKTKLVPFDIEKAKNGAKVVTRYGLPVKIVDYPIKNEEYPILGLVLIEGKEIPLLFTKTVNHYNNSESCYDLFIEEEVEEDDSDYDPYKSTVESLADMVERYSELQSLEELKHFYNNVKVKCREAIEYDNAWNKKQDEEPADNKPKFKVGDVMRTLEEAKADIIEGLPVVVSIDDDKYHCNNETIYIKDQDDYEYPPMNRLEINSDKWYICIEMCHSMDVIDFTEGHYYLGSDILKYGLLEKNKDYIDYFHPWNITDAKDGDVLAINNEVFIYAHRKQMYPIAVAYCFVDRAGGFYLDGEFGYTEGGNSIYPATKEQRDLLFQKIKEEGYEWNSNKKELKKIEKAKTRRMTNQELSWWLRDCQQERREVCRVDEDTIYSRYIYRKCDANEEVPEFVRIRKNGGEWQEPLIEI